MKSPGEPSPVESQNVTFDPPSGLFPPLYILFPSARLLTEYPRTGVSGTLRGQLTVFTPLSPVKSSLTDLLPSSGGHGTGQKLLLVPSRLTGVSVPSYPGPGQRVYQVVLTVQGTVETDRDHQV